MIGPTVKPIVIFALTLVGFAFLAGCSHRYAYEPVKRFPHGIQIDTLASASATEISPSVVQRSFPGPVAQVWNAAVRVARALKRKSVLTEAHVTVDSEQRTIEIRRELVNQEASAGNAGRARKAGNIRLPCVEQLSLLHNLRPPFDLLRAGPSTSSG